MWPCFLALGNFQHNLISWQTSLATKNDRPTNDSRSPSAFTSLNITTSICLLLQHILCPRYTKLINASACDDIILLRWLCTYLEKYNSRRLQISPIKHNHRSNKRQQHWNAYSINCQTVPTMTSQRASKSSHIYSLVFIFFLIHCSISITENVVTLFVSRSIWGGGGIPLFLP